MALGRLLVGVSVERKARQEGRGHGAMGRMVGIFVASPKTRVPPEAQMGVEVKLEKLSEVTAEQIRNMSEGEMIGRIENRGTANYSGLQFELQRRFTEKLVRSIGAGKVAAWALVVVTTLLVLVTAFLGIATWRLGS